MWSVRYRKICRSPQNIAQFSVYRILSHNSSFIAHFRTICYSPQLVLLPFIQRIRHGASWYHDLGRVHTMTWRPGASWYHDPGQSDTDTACLEAQNQQNLWSLISFCDFVANSLIITTVRCNLFSPCSSLVMIFTSWIVIWKVQPPVNTRHWVTISITLARSLSQHN
jgi:hypothetical protein